MCDLPRRVARVHCRSRGARGKPDGRLRPEQSVGLQRACPVSTEGIRSMSRDSMHLPEQKTARKLARVCALLLAGTLGVATAADAADSKAKQTEQQQIQALQQQLQAVEAQLKQLADQNRALLQHQQQIEEQLAQQAQQNAQAVAAAPSASGLPGSS